MKNFNPLLTGELYNSPSRDKNEAKYGIRSENQCICCMKPLKSGQFKMVHLNTNMNVVHKLVKSENCKELTGAESQGFFEVGNNCAKKMKNGFIHPVFATATA
jgi:hypothetical protein